MRPKYRTLLALSLIGLADCVLILAYWPSLADSLEAYFFIQPSSAPPSEPPIPIAYPQGFQEDLQAICQPPTLPATRAALDDDTPVIGVLAAGQARAYLLEAFEHGPASHLVNDVLGGVPISVTHCDISGCTRVFTGVMAGRPLELFVGDVKNSRMTLKFGGRFYSHETSQPVDEGCPSFPYAEYPSKVVTWREWQQAHPETDVYMGSVEEPTPPEAGGPKVFSQRRPSTETHPTS
jgi:hypothetical protein